jgi:hypothetical protein
MFGAESGGKCIIMHFLGWKKIRKALNTEFAETPMRKDLRKIRATERQEMIPGELKAALRFLAKSFICKYIDHRSL